MSDLISRSDAIKAVESAYKEPLPISLAYPLEDIINILKALPSADAVQEAVPTVVRVTMSDGSQYYLEHERDAIQADAVQGEWIRHELWGNPWFTCSECNYHGRNDFNYCPNCGAEMMTKESEE